MACELQDLPNEDQSMQPEQRQSNDPSIPYQEGIRVDETIHIKRAVADVYNAWRDVQHLPQIMRHLKSVTPLTGTAPTGWRKTSGPRRRGMGRGVIMDTARRTHRLAVTARVRRRDRRIRELHADKGRAPNSRSHSSTTRPGGIVGMGIAKLFGTSIADDIREDLRAFRDAMEAANTNIGT